MVLMAKVKPCGTLQKMTHVAQIIKRSAHSGDCEHFQREFPKSLAGSLIRLEFRQMFVKLK